MFPKSEKYLMNNSISCFLSCKHDVRTGLSLEHRNARTKVFTETGIINVGNYLRCKLTSHFEQIQSSAQKKLFSIKLGNFYQQLWLDFLKKKELKKLPKIFFQFLKRSCWEFMLRVVILCLINSGSWSYPSLVVRVKLSDFRNTKYLICSRILSSVEHEFKCVEC